MKVKKKKRKKYFRKAESSGRYPKKLFGLFEDLLLIFIFLGLVRHDEWLISTSVDQRVVVHSVREEDREVRAEIVADLTATVPDAHGLALLSAAQSLSVCVYGKGIEVISIDLNS